MQGCGAVLKWPQQIQMFEWTITVIINLNVKKGSNCFFRFFFVLLFCLTHSSKHKDI